MAAITVNTNAALEIGNEFGFEEYFGSAPRQGWLLSFSMNRGEKNDLCGTLYFVDANSINFKVRIPFFASFLVSKPDNEDDESELVELEDSLLRQYSSLIHSVELVNRIDTNKHNHLNISPLKYLKVYSRTESALNQLIREIPNNENNLKIHEYDIPHELSFADQLGIRAGKWFAVSYNGTNYTLQPNDRITYPDLRILAFDIETTKPPLKFPNSSTDQIMMISLMSESFGELIINRKIVSHDITPFEYKARHGIEQVFKISNEEDEESLLVRFIELIREYKPHIITTYNGAYFDWPFIDARANMYGISISGTLSVQHFNEYYDSEVVPHLDCFKWVKRDSYLPMNSHGLKAVTRAKLGYFPEEIDPEDMVEYARSDPQRLASYSVSDAVATYYLYMEYVHSHVFSIASLIPLPPVQILCRGSGTLCEALLVSEARRYGLLVPPKSSPPGLIFRNGKLVESQTYVGGHVESLRAGIFRSDFVTSFTLDKAVVPTLLAELHTIFGFDGENDVTKSDDGKRELCAALEAYQARLETSVGGECGDQEKATISERGQIYHLDVAAMYPNIILTNRMQPHAVVDEDECIHCDYNVEGARCKRKMEWVSRAEVYPLSSSEVKMLAGQIKREASRENRDAPWDRTRKSHSTLFGSHLDSQLLRERAAKYSQSIYKRSRVTSLSTERVTICQRAIPFYVETVRQFRDKRLVIKEEYKGERAKYELNPTEEGKKRVVVLSSLQTAYKCVLNSFYGYAMRTGSRWFSLEMAAAVCKVGSELIRETKTFVERIGIPLELDTDGIWALIPESFPASVLLDGRKHSFLAYILNHFVCARFTNKDFFEAGEFRSANSINFEADGPYRAMVIPASTEENCLLKKRYAVFNEENEVVELKGFELKRRGELKFIKRFQEELFNHFGDGSNLDECYAELGQVCNYWLDILEKEGAGLSEEALFELFSESRSMSKRAAEYGERRSNILGTARRIAECLGDDMLEDKLKCEFVISRFPTGRPTAERAIPVLIFKHPEKKHFLRRWLQCDCTELRRIIDWNYYRRRFESLLLRMVCIPAHRQGVPNPVPRIKTPKWAVTGTSGGSCVPGKLGFTRRDNIEVNNIECNSIGVNLNIEDVPVLHRTELNTSRASNPVSLNSSLPVLLSLVLCSPEQFSLQFSDGSITRHPIIRSLFLDLNGAKNPRFDEFETVQLRTESDELRPHVLMRIPESELRTEKYRRFFDHFAIRKTYISPVVLYELLNSNTHPCGLCLEGWAVLSSFTFNKKRMFCVTLDGQPPCFVAEGGWHKKYLEPDVNNNLMNLNICTGKLINLIKKEKRIKILITDLNEQIDGWNGIVVRVCSKVPVCLEGLLATMNRHAEFHSKMKSDALLAVELSILVSVPLFNVLDSLNSLNRKCFDLLDLLFYKELRQASIIPASSGYGLVPSLFEEEYCRSGYYSTFTAEIDCSGSGVLSVVEYAMIDERFPGTERAEFKALRKMLRELVIEAVTRINGREERTPAEILLKEAPAWMKGGSFLISKKLLETITVLHNKYISGLINEMKQMQIKVIGVSKELILIDTGKRDIAGVEEYIEYVKKKVRGIGGYELVRLRVLRIFSRLGFIDFDNCFYKEVSHLGTKLINQSGTKLINQSDTKLISQSGTKLIDEQVSKGRADAEVPLEFLELYFGDLEINNEQIYDLITDLTDKSAKILLRLLSYKRDTHGLASNCYKLLRISEFTTEEKFRPGIPVFCPGCGFENLMRRKCLKCHSVLENSVLEKVAEGYLAYLWDCQRSSERHCVRCNQACEKRLRDYCRCGGRFEYQDCTGRVKELTKFIGTPRIAELSDEFCEYFLI